MDRSEILKILGDASLRKAKTKLLADAVANGEATKGNHQVTCTDLITAMFFTMKYRDTPILAAAMVKHNNTWLIQEIHAGDYDNTPATIRQRQEFKLAIDEMREVVESNV